MSTRGRRDPARDAVARAAARRAAPSPVRVGRSRWRSMRRAATGPTPTSCRSGCAISSSARPSWSSSAGARRWGSCWPRRAVSRPPRPSRSSIACERTVRSCRRSVSGWHAGSRIATWRRRPSSCDRCCRPGFSSVSSWSPSLRPDRSQPARRSMPPVRPDSRSTRPSRISSPSSRPARAPSVTSPGPMGGPDSSGACVHSRRTGGSASNGCSSVPGQDRATSAGSA